MKTIGLIGGLSWESTLEYYRIINQQVRNLRGHGLESAKIVLYSFNFAEIVVLQNQHRWDEATARMVEAGISLRNSGAEFLAICTNTMHLMADQVSEAAGLPLIHIADVAAERVKAQGLRRVGLLGTRFTMEADFYRERMRQRHGLDVIIPEEPDRSIVHQIIYEELCAGVIKPESKEVYKGVIHRLGLRGAEGVLLGCTEIPLLVQQSDCALPLFDTTTIHAEAIAEQAVGQTVHVG